ncbi:MAG: sulfatase, partial [Myxococcota bacterium]
PTVASIFTGVYPEVHRVTNYQAVLSEEFVTLAEAFQAAGYRTGARISNILINGPHGYHQGFDDAHLVMNLYKLLFMEKLLTQARITPQYYFARGDEIANAGLDWLRRHKDERFFFYLHYYDPHFPYYPPADYAMRYVEPEMAKRFPYRAFVADTIWNMVSEFKLGIRRSPEEIAYIKAVYDAEINYADDQVARVLDYLDETGLADNTIVIFTADHGEQFYEHGQKLHSKTLYNEEIHVPLIIKAPGYAPRVIKDRVRGLDIYRTLIALAGLPSRLPAAGIGREIEAQAMGASLVPLMKGEALPPGSGGPVYSSLDMDTVIKEAYFEDAWKLIRNVARGDDIERPPVELYRLPSDPGEDNNLAGREAAARARLTDRAAKGRAAMAERAVTGLTEKPLSKSEVEKLKALGYINQ